MSTTDFPSLGEVQSKHGQQKNQQPIYKVKEKVTQDSSQKLPSYDQKYQRKDDPEKMQQFVAKGPSRPTKNQETIPFEYVYGAEEEKKQRDLVILTGQQNHHRYYQHRQQQDFINQPQEDKKYYKHTRQCKFQMNCRYLYEKGECDFFHSEEEIRKAQKSFKQIEEQKNKERGPIYNISSKMKGEELKRYDKEKVTKLPQEKNKQKQYSGYFSYTFLLDLLLIEDITELKNKIDNLAGSLIQRLNATKMELKIPFLLVKLLKKLIPQKSKPLVRGILTQFMESDFIKNLSKYFNKTLSDFRFPVEQREQECLIGIFVIISLMDTFPSRIQQFQQVVMALSSGAEMIKISYKGISSKIEKFSEITEQKDNLMERFKELSKLVQQEQEEMKARRFFSRQQIKPNLNLEYKQMPEQDFKKINVFPNEEEICHRNRSIRRMPKEGNLLNKSNYLDILFRLLHDDSIHDLRVGVKFMRNMENDQEQLTRGQFRKKLKEETSVKMYDGIYLQNLDFIEGSRCIQFRLEMDKKRFVDWRIAKKLLPGSLVIISHDNFRTLFIGLLKNYDGKQRNETHQKFGYISVNVEIVTYPDNVPSGFELFQVHGRTNFQMIESSAYFESYRHVLSQLQQMDTWDQIPMQNYLVQGRSDQIEQPEYISDMLDDKVDEINEMINEMNFDESQFEAVKQVFENELTLIQGPPGTGKTYIGVQVVKILIRYSQYWQDKGPILLVCYTNHALHQFLDFIQEFTQKIIKIGGKNLPQYHQYNLKEKLMNYNMGKGYSKIYRELKESEYLVKYAQSDLSKYQFKIMNTLLKEEDSEDCVYIQKILKTLSKQFKQYLIEQINLAFYGQESYLFLREIIEENFKKLRYNTKDNIIVLIWLGIIDIQRFINFMILEEDRKNEIRKIDNELQQCQQKQQYCQRNMDKCQEESLQIQRKIEECNQFISQEEDQKKKGRRGQNRQFKSLYHAKQLLEQYQRDLQNKQVYYNSQKSISEKQNEFITEFYIQIQMLKAMGNNFQYQNYEQNNIDNNDQIESDQRDLDYDDYRFEYSNDFVSLQDVLGRIFIPDCVSDIFDGANSIYDCIGIANTFYLEDEEQTKQIIKKIIFHQNIFDENQFELQIRWSINNYLLDNIIQNHLKIIDRYIESYKNAWDKKQEKESDCAAEIIKGQHIVAMTTTGRAKYAQYFENITFPIVIVEEAAEVFEAHIITSLSKNTEHLILIGDHEQLRPSPAVHELDIQYNLSVSMFERLISNKISHATLSIQRRMRPEISKIMNLIYPDLENHSQVSRYPNVKGISKNLFFFDHKWREDKNDFMISYYNLNEAKMIVRFAQYIIQQKQYQGNDVTILTLYAGQLIKIKSLLKENPLYESHLKQIRVVNVDNFQGEENQIILLSLVRSNTECKIGFLKTSNRVCVALSRAKHGLYIFGNSTCLIGAKKKLNLWLDVINHFKENEFFGDYLPLKCQNHDTVAQIKTVEDFTLVPEGGCQQECNVRLECGHNCEAICHPYNISEVDPTGHDSYTCKKDCQRELLCEHPCVRKCFECKNKNQPCKTLIDKKIELCGHVIQIECHEKDSNSVKCKAKCEKILKCGHNCALSCFDDCYKKKCKAPVESKLECGHTQLKDCHENISEVKCFNECNQLLSCGHRCQAICSACKTKGEHAQCTQQCNRMQVCGHFCEILCSKNCPPCDKECQTKCSHSKCILKCNQICILCMEPCANQCPHQQCTKKCSQPCDRQPCDLPCDKKQKCGHPCAGLCGEICPIDLCRICQPDCETFNEIIFGHEDDKNAIFIQIDCGHQFEVRGLDQWMKEEEKQESSSVKYKQCIKCKKPIMKCPRYMKQINSTLNDVNFIKNEIIKYEKEYKEKLINVENDISELNIEIRNFAFKSSIYFKTCFEFCEKIEKKFDKIRNQREPQLVQQILQCLKLNHDIFMLAKIDNSKRLQLIENEKNFIEQTMKNVRANYLQLQFAPTMIEECSNFTNQLANKFQMNNELKIMIDEIGISRGHWNKCSNGHYYVITDCVGEQETSKCPDCQLTVGESKHVFAS